MIPIHVTSEIKPLKKVLLHRPGKELEQLVPDNLESLLFDDIPFLKVAQQEHDAFASILKDNGIQVVYLEDLMAETLSISPEIKLKFLMQFIDEAGVKSNHYKSIVYDFLNEISDIKEFVLKTMEGINFNELNCTSGSSLVELLTDKHTFIVPPMPNLYFTRDPFATIGTGISLNKMYSVTRNRETIYAEYIFAYHPEYNQNVLKFYDRYHPYHIEGGDVLNLTEKVLAIGISQRTSPDAIENLANSVFSQKGCQIETILAIDIPNSRAFMHLDTVFTQVDYDKFTIHPGILGPLRVFEITQTKQDTTLSVKELTTSLEEVLQKYLNLEKVTLIQCGGGDRIAAEREQWNDGSNTLCIAPGVIVVYERNHITNQVLRDYGLTVIEMPSAELSRGRGGPRCMSMPLVRET